MRAGGRKADQKEDGAKISLNVSTPPSLRPGGGRRTDLLIAELSLTQRAAGIRHHDDDDDDIKTFLQLQPGFLRAPHI